MTFSIVIATCDRPERLGRTLDALGKAVDATDGCEVIVVDNGPTKPAKQVVEGQKTGSVHARYLTSATCNKSAALNVGIDAAKYDWLAFTDDDTLPDKNWLAKAVQYAKETSVGLFGGKVSVGECDCRIPAWLRPGRSGLLPKGPALVDYAPLSSSGVLGRDCQVPLGANFFVRKYVFDKYGKYDEHLWKKCGKAALGSEDAEFAMRVRSAGIPIGYCAEAVVNHPIYRDRMTIAAHWRWAYYFGYREPILFGSRTSKAYLLKTASIALAGIICRIATSDPAAAVCEMMNCAKALGTLRSLMNTAG